MTGSRHQGLHIVRIARDDLDVVPRGTCVGRGNDDRVNTRRSRIEASAHDLRAKRARGMAQLLTDVSNVNDLQQSAHMEVVPGVPGKNSLRENRGGDDKVRRPPSQDPETRTPPLIDRRKRVNAGRIEHDDQPAALLALVVAGTVPVA